MSNEIQEDCFSSELCMWRFNLADACDVFLRELTQHEKGNQIKEKFDVSWLITCVEEFNKLQNTGLKNEPVTETYDSFTGFIRKETNMGGRGDSSTTAKRRGNSVIKTHIDPIHGAGVYLQVMDKFNNVLEDTKQEANQDGYAIAHKLFSIELDLRNLKQSVYNYEKGNPPMTVQNKINGIINNLADIQVQAKRGKSVDKDIKNSIDDVNDTFDLILPTINNPIK